MWYYSIIIIKVDQKLSDLFQGTHSQTFNKVKKSPWLSPLLKVKQRTFTFEQESTQLDFTVKENEFLMWYYSIIIIIVDQKLSDLFQGTHSQTFNKVKKSPWLSPLLKVKQRTFTFEQESTQLDFTVKENEFLMWYYSIIIIIVDQKLSDLFQGTHSQTFNKVKKSPWLSPLLKLKAYFFRHVGPPQPDAAKVTVLYVAKVANLNLT